jgi:hypothetical protein
VVPVKLQLQGAWKKIARTLYLQAQMKKFHRHLSAKGLTDVISYRVFQ